MSSTLPPTAAAGSSAEAQAAAFADDPRIYFSQEAQTWRLEEDDGTELEYDSAKGAWVALVDEDLVKRQQAAYSIAGVDEETPAAPVLARENKKRKEPEDYTGYGAASGSASEPSTKKGKKNKDGTERKSKNTAVYVTGLPADTELEELVETFSKYGILEEDDDGEPKVKMYAKDDGSFSGDALVVYFKEESVILAVNLLDESELRIGDSKTIMSVKQADFKHKGSGGGGGEGRAEAHQHRKVVDKKKATRRIVKMQKRLAEWDDEDGFGPSKDPEDTPDSALVTSRVVVLKYMFTLEELEEDPTLLLDLKEDVREECESLGEVTNVVLYDQEKDGVMTVKFRDPISAQACILRMNGRFFAGRQVVATLFTGKQRFKRSNAGEEYEGDGAEAEKKRLDDFAEWLMAED